MTEPEDFDGAKLILFLGDQLAVLRRDDKPDIPWPDYLDLPGGQREQGETPEQCAIRETREELGLDVLPKDLVWSSRVVRSRGPIWYFAARLAAERVADVVFGNEGQGWCMMTPEAYMAHAEAIPHFKDQVRAYLKDAGAAVG